MKTNPTKQQNNAGPASAPSPLVLAVATEDYMDKWAFCLDSQKHYSSVHNYACAQVEPSGSKLHPKWAKLEIALFFLKRDRDLLLIDADAEMTRLCPPFTSILSENQHKDIFYVNGNSGRPNSGVLIMRGGSSSAATSFVQECLARRLEAVPKEDFVTKEGENGHVIMLLKQLEFANKALALPKIWNCSDPACYPEAFVLHYTNKLRVWLSEQKQGTKKNLPNGG